MKLLGREDDSRRAFEATIHGWEYRVDHGPRAPGQTHRRTGLRSFHDRISRRIKGR